MGTREAPLFVAATLLATFLGIFFNNDFIWRGVFIVSKIDKSSSEI